MDSLKCLIELEMTRYKLCPSINNLEKIIELANVVIESGGEVIINTKNFVIVYAKFSRYDWVSVFQLEEGIDGEFESY